jgi:hypothetical protein
MPLTSSEPINPVDLGSLASLSTAMHCSISRLGAHVRKQIDNAVVRLQHFAFLLPQGSERLAEPQKSQHHHGVDDEKS